MERKSRFENESTFQSIIPDFKGESIDLLDRKAEIALRKRQDFEFKCAIELKRRQEAEESMQTANLLKERAKACATAYPFRQFIYESFPIIEKGREFKSNWHIDAIAEILQAATVGDIKNLILNIPRRTMKSLLVCVMWQAWVWTFLPQTRWVFTSYSAEFAKRDSEKTKDLILSKYYQDRWGSTVKLTTERRGKIENSAGGFRVVFRIGKGVGEGGDFVCLLYDAIITTDKGLLQIGDIVENKLNVKVLAFDHELNQTVWQDITQYEKNKGRASVEIKLSNGTTLKVTDNHSVFIKGKGYIKACELVQGDKVLDDKELRDLQQGNKQTTFSFCEKQGGCLLFSRLPRKRSDRKQKSSMGRRESVNCLRNLRFGFPSKKGNDEAEIPAEILLKSMQRAGFHQTFRRNSPNSEMFTMQNTLSESSGANRREDILLKNVRGLSTQGISTRNEQSKISTRELHRALSDRVQSYRSPNSETRQLSMPVVRNERNAKRQSLRRSSYRLQQRKQQLREFNFFMPFLSREATRFTETETDATGVFVESVTRIETPEYVYNLNIPVQHNYFANSILVHNCADDPNAIDEVESETILDRTNRGWSEVAFNNVTDRSTAVRAIIQQRTAPNDLTGHIVEDKELCKLYNQLCLPMKFDEDHPYKNSISKPFKIGTVSPFDRVNDTELEVGEEKLWIDPRNIDAPFFQNKWYQKWYKKNFHDKGLDSKGQGQLLWETYLTAELVAQDIAHLKAYGEHSQFQQLPTRRGGNFFDSNLFLVDGKAINPENLDYDNMSYCRFWDKAGTDNAGDWTVGILVGVTNPQGGRLKHPRKCYIIDIKRFQRSAYKRMDIIVETAEQDVIDYVENRENTSYCVGMEIEPASSGKDIATMEKDALLGFDVRARKPKGTKAWRATTPKATSEAGRLKIVRGDWNTGFIGRLEKFNPSRTNNKDDEIDALSGALKEILFTGTHKARSSSGY